MKQTQLQQLVYIALAVALLITLSQITIAIGPIPFTLQTLAVGLIASLFPWRLALSSVGLYLLLGGIGLPVFAGFSGGMTSLFVAPTAGFLWGFLTYALITSLLTQRHTGLVQVFAANLLGVASCFILGVLFFKFNLGTSWSKTVALTCLPFLLPEICKISLICLAQRSLQPILKNKGWK